MSTEVPATEATPVPVPVTDGRQPSGPGYTSLYVGDLSPEITEADLFNLFRQIGPVNSIRLNRDVVTRRSLCYAYVNYTNPKDADSALNTLNFYEIAKGFFIRIMWSQRDPSLRRSGVGNVFVKNLPPHVDQKDLYDLFSTDGNIMSCKIVLDEKGDSRGYGYVHYETEEQADKAVAKFDGAEIEGQHISVQPFKPKSDRETAFTNLYVKNFPKEFTDEQFREMFTPFGDVSSAVVIRNEEHVSRGFGFVNFKTAACAAETIAQMHGKEMEGGLILYVQRAQKKEERRRTLMRDREEKKSKRRLQFQNCNLYVKNLPEGITDEELYEMFSAFGTIISHRVARNEMKLSRGFGYVCFSSAEEALEAIKIMKNKVYKGKPLYVAYHQSREDRQKIFETYTRPIHYQQGLMRPNMRMMMPRWAGPAMAGPMPRGGGGARRPARRHTRGGRYPPRVHHREGMEEHHVASMPGMTVVPGPAVMPMQTQGTVDVAQLSSLPPEQQQAVVGNAIYEHVLQLSGNEPAARQVTGHILHIYNGLDDQLDLLGDEEKLREAFTEAMNVITRQ
eukprot:TRINITY_DN97_c0_g1_i1.p1 TRINITY_DN97_c0_g1~~TRINITY_DN97_c0_g1_i1.p1  ORF type:complete len:562 (-),score=158.39 TRINITY_DN97_c0_g1_i1:216-1901(-)